MALQHSTCLFLRLHFPVQTVPMYQVCTIVFLYIRMKCMSPYLHVPVQVRSCEYVFIHVLYLFFSFYLLLYYQIYSPAELVRGFTLSNLLDKPWSHVSLLLFFPPVHAFTFIAHRVQHPHLSASDARRFASNLALSHLRPVNFEKKSLAGFEPTASASIAARRTAEPSVTPVHVHVHVSPSEYQVPCSRI